MARNSDGRLLPCLIGGSIVAFGGWITILLVSSHFHLPQPLTGLIVFAALFVVSAVIAVQAPSRASAWRRLLALAAALSFAAAVATLIALMGGAPDAIKANRSENAPGIAMFVLLGALVLTFLGPAFFILAGLVFAFLAWAMGRAPRLRKAKSEVPFPPSRR